MDDEEDGGELSSKEACSSPSIGDMFFSGMDLSSSSDPFSLLGDTSTSRSQKNVSKGASCSSEMYSSPLA